MTMKSNLREFTVQFEQTVSDLRNKVAELTKESITDGSTITGSPGQPVDTGTLRASWQETIDDDGSTLIATNIAYARAIENNTRAEYDPKGVLPPPGIKEERKGGTNRKKSERGGSHSVKMTHAGFDRILKHAVKSVVR